MSDLSTVDPNNCPTDDCEDCPLHIVEEDRHGLHYHRCGKSTVRNNNMKVKE